MIRNPVLPGFHPDPSILRVGSDYYIATSTFEWFPGVRVHHSRDLVHWRHRTHLLTRPSQIDLRGRPRSGGVWAPCLSHDGESFHLVYSDVRNWGGRFLDCHNWLVTAPDIDGPWSDPIFLNSSGFDPSLFHDAGGRKWLVNMLWDHRGSGPAAFGGIVLQEYAADRRKLVGEARVVFEGSELGITEGPHLYRHDGWYYLMVAEGGTSWDHAVTLARARSLDGPYELDPERPLLTSRGGERGLLQKAGHGSLVETPDGEWYLAHLCARPVGPDRRSILGRETALQRVEWTRQGWLRLVAGGPWPAEVVPAPAAARAAPRAAERPPSRDDFEGTRLGGDFQTLRAPADRSWLSLIDRPGWLRLRGRESLQSLHEQSLVARRVQAPRCRFETLLEFRPRTFQQMAGLVCFYDDENHYYLYVRHAENGPRVGLLAAEGGEVRHLLASGPGLGPEGRVALRGELDGAQLRFWCSPDGRGWTAVGPALDATILSDERAGRGLGFTGAFVGVCAQDLGGERIAADFDYFDYFERGVADETGEIVAASVLLTSANGARR